MTLVEKAQKVLTFKMNIAKECKKKGLSMPSDKQISDYINQGYGMELYDFMQDFIEHEGIFREPISDFCKELEKYDFGGNKPTLEDVKKWVDKNGYDVSLFVRQFKMNNLKGFYRKTLEGVLKMDERELIDAWNWFIKESGFYDIDNVILDLSEYDKEDIYETFTKYYHVKNISCLHEMLNNNLKYFQLIKNKKTKDVEIVIVDFDIIDLIVSNWVKIVDRIMSFPFFYHCSNFMDVFEPIICEMCKVPYRQNENNV